MIRKSGNRFSGKIMPQQRAVNASVILFAKMAASAGLPWSRCRGGRGEIRPYFL
jgi:hypothetical protein